MRVALYMRLFIFDEFTQEKGQILICQNPPPETKLLCEDGRGGNSTQQKDRDEKVMGKRDCDEFEEWDDD